MSDATSPTNAALTVAEAIANLRSPDLSQRYYAAWWLGKMRAREAVDALLRSLEDEEDRTSLGGYPLRRNAARALGKLGDLRAIPGLIESLRCEDFYVREAAAQAIEQLARTEEGFLATQTCVRPLAVLLGGNLAAEARQMEQPYEAILEALGRLRAYSERDAIEPFLEHPVARIRFAAARAMYGLTSDSKYAERLVHGLSDPDVNLRRVVLTDLGEIGYLPAADAIAHCQAESSFRLFALKGILDAHIGNAEYDPDLAATLQHVMLLMDDLL